MTSISRRPSVVWLLAILVPLLFWWYWYWQLVQSVRFAARKAGVQKLGPRPLISLAMLSAGVVLVLPALIALVQTSRLVRRTQAAITEEPRCRTWVAPMFVVVGAAIVLSASAVGGVLGILTVVAGMAIAYAPVPYLQAHANQFLAEDEQDWRRKPLQTAALAILALLWSAIFLPISVLSAAGVLATYEVPAGSMEPTFRCGDRFVVEEITSRSTHPKRGDVVAFHPPAADGDPTAVDLSPRDFDGFRTVAPADVTYFKRVVGLPGDTVALRQHRAVVNGKTMPEPYVKASSEGSGDMGTMDAVKIPDGTYWLLGDHRDNSADSRFFGPVPQRFIVGRVVLIYWPPDHFGSTTRDFERERDEEPDPACAEAAS